MMEDLIEKRTAQERLIIAKTLIESVLYDLQPEPTLEQIKEYCRKRCLSIVDNALLEKYASAQPTDAEIQKMQDVEQAMLDKAYECGKLDAVQWIPCSERLPEVGRSVLLSVGGMYTAEGCLREDGDWTQFRWDAIQRKDMVGAWMPLPSSYRENAEGRTNDKQRCN